MGQAGTASAAAQTAALAVQVVAETVVLAVVAGATRSTTAAPIRRFMIPVPKALASASAWEWRSAMQPATVCVAPLLPVRPIRSRSATTVRMTIATVPPTSPTARTADLPEAAVHPQAPLELLLARPVPVAAVALPPARAEAREPVAEVKAAVELVVMAAAQAAPRLPASHCWYKPRTT